MNPAEPLQKKCCLKVSSNSCRVVVELRKAGFETYIVGGAIRDLLLGMSPKDFDIVTAADPEEIREIFGRRRSRIIGKRFRLVHVYCNGELFEVSTFRKTPDNNAVYGNSVSDGSEKLPQNMIISDNEFGTAREDAWRRDFTINALFYDPVEEVIIDHTGLGLSDIDNKTVRAIGDPMLRFEEDPVRILRALKLVGQCRDFTLDNATENALFRQMELIRHVSLSRLSLELEKILQSHHGDLHLQAFHDYGLLDYFLPEISALWNTPAGKYMQDLLFERNCRVEEGYFRNSISLALAAVALPFVESGLKRDPGTLWQNTPESRTMIRAILSRICAPQTVMTRVEMSAERILLLQCELDHPAESKKHAEQIIQHHSYSHARELMLIRRAVAQDDLLRWQDEWPEVPERNRSPRKRKSARKPVRQK